ncbi:putative phosphatase [Geobacter sp. OR-1]|uniref:phosphatase n=1 Tax=Geobacter sp. OR-1 TaxID=1266765 RepID=UPI0005427038|nr:phosphatase [Geobacter sp. OR-1]GAM11219.1 putative phosphatase [Geobacter sp. OR-1]
MKIIADMHTHTISSGHAYSTINELAASAAQKGLQALAVTDHGPALPGGPHIYHFGAMRFIPREISGVRIFAGCEANILDSDGKIDLPENYLSRLDFVMAGFHEFCGFDDKGTGRNTEAMINAMHNPGIHAISHPGNPAFPVDYEAIAREASLTGTALEINNASFTFSRCGSRPNCEKLARQIGKFHTPVIVGSDAHIAQNVGEFAVALEVIAGAGIEEAQVVNSDLERLIGFLKPSG